MRPAIRNGLLALIVILLAVNAAVVFDRHGNDDHTRVSVAPAPSTPTETSTTVIPTTVIPTTVIPTTVIPTTVIPPALSPADTGAVTTSTTPSPAGTGSTDTTTPPTDAGAVQAAPVVPTEHPHTGGHALSVVALLLVGVGLGGLRCSRRMRASGR